MSFLSILIILASVCEGLVENYKFKKTLRITEGQYHTARAGMIFFYMAAIAFAVWYSSTINHIGWQEWLIVAFLPVIRLGVFEYTYELGQRVKKDVPFIGFRMKFNTSEVYAAALVGVLYSTLYFFINLND